MKKKRKRKTRQNKLTHKHKYNIKRIITYNFSCLVIAIAFSSCAAEFSITKRHHNKGVYIDYVGRNTGERMAIKKNKLVNENM